MNRLFSFEDIARQDLRSSAWLASSDHPILGLGWGDFTTVAAARYPHNAPLEVAAELGLVGLIAFIALLFGAALRTWRSRTTGEVRVLGAVAVAALVGQQFGSDLSNRFFWIAVIPTLLFVRFLRQQELSSVESRRAPAPLVRTRGPRT